jgi:uncharacterized phiE125 gp8 family phage protein
MTLFSLDPAAIPAADAELILPLALAKAHLRVDGSEEDALIEALRAAAIHQVEQYCSIPLTSRAGFVWQGDAGCFADGGAIRLGVHPVTAITSIDATDASGVTISATPADFVLGPHDMVRPKPGKSWPDSTGGAAISFTAGLSSPAKAPSLLQAVRLMLGHLYENREAMLEGAFSDAVPPGVISACARMRMPVL